MIDAQGVESLTAGLALRLGQPGRVADIRAAINEWRALQPPETGVASSSRCRGCDKPAAPFCVRCAVSKGGREVVRNKAHDAVDRAVDRAIEGAAGLLEGLLGGDDETAVPKRRT